MRYRPINSSRRFAVLAAVVAVLMAIGQSASAIAPPAPGPVAASSVAAATSLVAGAVVTTGPSRIADSRDGLQIPGWVSPLAAVPVQVTGRGGIPDSGVASVLVNVNVIWPLAAGYLTVWPSGMSRPDTSTLNFQQGQTIANAVIVPVGPDGKIQVFNGSPGSVHVVVDASSYTVAGVPSAAGSVASLTPARIADSRSGLQIPAAVPSFSTAQVKVTGHGGIPDSGVLDVLAHVTVVWPWASGYLTV